jgi:hypothetical protein
MEKEPRMVGPSKIRRTGVVRTLTLDHDAAQLLDEMVPSHKGYGRYLSELLRNERIRQEERARFRQQVAHGEAERACG